MAITTLISTVQEPQERKPRTKKADRDFSPPELGLRPSRYRLAERVYAHFARARNDYQYRQRWEAFETEELRRRLVETDRRSSERASNKNKPRKQYKPRVRASELKNCARQQAFRLMGFKEAPTGVDSPWWNLAAISGTGLHERIEIALKFIGLSRRSEFNVYSQDGTFSGRVDHELDPAFFVEDLGDEALGAILDVKTTKGKDFADGCWSQKMEGYISQVSTYCRLTNNPIGVILLVDRNEGKLMDVEFDADPDHGDKMLRRATKIAEYAENRRLPKPESYENGKPTFACYQFCPFKQYCDIQEASGAVQRDLDEGRDPKEL